MEPQTCLGIRKFSNVDPQSAKLDPQSATSDQGGSEVNQHEEKKTNEFSN